MITTIQVLSILGDIGLISLAAYMAYKLDKQSIYIDHLEAIIERYKREHEKRIEKLKEAARKGALVTNTKKRNAKAQQHKDK